MRFACPGSLSSSVKAPEEKRRGSLRAAAAFASRLRGDKRGNILTIFAIALPLMIGGLGLGVEGANWYQTKRALQNAADQAVDRRGDQQYFDLSERSQGGDSEIRLHQRHRERNG